MDPNRILTAEPTEDDAYILESDVQCCEKAYLNATNFLELWSKVDVKVGLNV
jgi:hypothetical protein